MSLLFTTWTVLVCVVFIGVLVWALAPRQRAEFERAARIPLEDDDNISGGPGRG